MKRVTWAALAACAAVLLGGCGEDEPTGDGAADPTGSTAAPATAGDAEWCATWRELVALQGQWVAAPTAANADAVLATVDKLRTLGVPASLDPSGYTELTAVLDDVQASVDPSFTPTVLPSEPADVVTGSDEDDHGDDDGDDHEHGHGAEDAPFGAWLATYCS